MAEWKMAKGIVASNMAEDPTLHNDVIEFCVDRNMTVELLADLYHVSSETGGFIWFSEWFYLHKDLLAQRKGGRE